jgi:alpha-N-arabinofuranosidase
MPTYGAWEYEVLDHCFNEVDYISLHAYFRNDRNSIDEFFTVLEDLNSFIKEVAAICDAVAAKRRSPKRIMLSLDEWNVWYKAHTPADLKKPGWPKAPPLIEEIYNFEDALIVGGALITLINNSDRVKAACIAQLVNVIGPIMTETGGPAWRQTIFHPFAQASKYSRGEVLRTSVETTSYSTPTHPQVSHLLTSVMHDRQSGTVTLLALNRSKEAAMELELELRGLGAGRKVTFASELHHADLKAVNSKVAPDAVAPATLKGVTVAGEVVRAQLKPLSWNVIVVEPAS